MKKNLARLEICLVVLSLTFFTGGLGSILPSSAMVSLFRYFIWLISGVGIFIQRKKVLYALKRNTLLCILTLVVSLSFLWSLYPIATIKDMREVGQMTLFALYFSTRFSLREQVKLVAFTLGLGALLSVVYAVIDPETAIHGSDHPGAWRGIYDYKNTFGSMMVLGSLAFFLLPIEKPIYNLYKWVGYGISLVMMLLSTSKTSLVLSFLLVFILLLYRKFRWQGKISVVYLDIAVLIFGCIGAFVLTQWVDILSGLGKDPTLTGRTVIWDYVTSQIWERPLLGFGRGAFYAPESPYAFAAGRQISSWYRPPHSHNGFIDLLLDVGFIGFFLFLASFFMTYFRSLRMAYGSKKPEDFWPLAYLMFLAMNNIMESYLLRLCNIYWVLYLTVAISLSIAPKNKVSDD
ncbi:O-antigen ligase family protein [Nostoc sp. TCL26-01]|nr:O-antigen ligase family protein [Nostoc sp. TCL26-01]